MHKIRLPLLVLAFGLMAIQPAAADDISDAAGTSGFSFLKINVGARPVSMGGAFTGLADDEAALYYNPAGIASLTETRYMLGYHNYFVDMQSGFLGLVKPLSETRVLAAWINYLSYGDMVETDNLGNVLGEFGGGDWLFGLSLAVSHRDNYQFGASVKFIYEKIHDYSATGLAVDLGARYVTNRERYSAGLMLQNLGVQLSSLGEVGKDDLPTTLRGGISARPVGLPILFSADVIVPFDNSVDFAVGGEYYELRPLFVRLGWNSFGSNYRTGASEDNWAGLSVGVGFEIKDLGFLHGAQISYSYSPAADLGESHRITLTGGA
jgi:hypothetical protein